MTGDWCVSCLLILDYFCDLKKMGTLTSRCLTSQRGSSFFFLLVLLHSLRSQMTESGIQDRTQVLAVGRWSMVVIVRPPLTPNLYCHYWHIIVDPIGYVSIPDAGMWIRASCGKNMYMYVYVCIVTQFRVSRIRLSVKADTHTGDSSEEIRIRVPDDWTEKSMGFDAGAGGWRFGGWMLRFCCCCGTGTGAGTGTGLRRTHSKS